MWASRRASDLSLVTNSERLTFEEGVAGYIECRAYGGIPPPNLLVFDSTTGRNLDLETTIETNWTASGKVRWITIKSWHIGLEQTSLWAVTQIVQWNSSTKAALWKGQPLSKGGYYLLVSPLSLPNSPLYKGHFDCSKSGLYRVVLLYSEKSQISPFVDFQIILSIMSRKKKKKTLARLEGHDISFCICSEIASPMQNLWIDVKIT